MKTKISVLLFLCFVSLFYVSAENSTTTKTNQLTYDRNRLYPDGQFNFLITSPTTVSAFNFVETSENHLVCSIPETTTIDHISYTVTSIDNYFLNSRSRTMILRIPKTITEIKPNAFSGDSLTTIEVDPQNQTFTSIQGLLYSKDCTALIRVPANNPITQFTAPETLEQISPTAFFNCRFLKEVVLTKLANQTQNIVFTGCSSLESINASKENSILSSINGVLYNKDGSMLLHYPAKKTGTIFNMPTQVTSLASQSFKTCNNLREIHCSPNLKNIDRDCFFKCENLTSIYLNDSVLKMGNFAFNTCKKLKRINFGKSTCDISPAHFIDCPSITEILVDKDGKFCFVDGVLFNKSKTSLILYPWGKTDTIYTVPESVLILSQKSVAFNTHLKKIHLPQNLKIIGESVFMRSEIQEIELPTSVTDIGDSPFFDCQKLQTIKVNWKIPPSINKRVFSSNNSFKLIVPETSKALYQKAPVWRTVYSPDGFEFSLNGIHYLELDPNLVRITKIDSTVSCFELSDVVEYQGETYQIWDIKRDTNTTVKKINITGIKQYLSPYLFQNFTNLSEIVVLNPQVNAISIKGVLYAKDATILIYYPSGKEDTTFTIPSSVTQIMSNAFKGNRYLEHVILPSSIKKLTYAAFYDFVGLKTITIPTSVTVIESEAFNGCTNLQQVNLPKNLKSIEPYTFSRCTNLKSIQLPNQLKEIGNNAFWGCRALDSIVIPNSVQKMGQYVFSNCSGLQAVKLSESLIALKRGTFWGCKKLLEITVPNSVASIDTAVFEGCISLQKATLPKNLEKISPLMLIGCKSLTTITFPDNLKEIGQSAFAQCKGLTAVEIPSTVTFIGKSAFYNCTNLTSILLPSSLKQIEDNTFSFCTALQSITLPNTLTRIGKSAFSNCTSLSQLTLPDNIATLDTMAFYNCTGLTSIELPKALTSIRYRLLYKCKQLNTITIPSSVKTIEKNAFYLCENIRSIRILNPKPIQVSGNVFSSISRDKCSLFVPSASLKLYKTSAYWSTFGNNIKPF